MPPPPQSQENFQLDHLGLMLLRPFQDKKIAPYNPFWDTEVVHSLDTRHSSGRAIVHNAQFELSKQLTLHHLQLTFSLVPLTYRVQLT